MTALQSVTSAFGSDKKVFRDFLPEGVVSPPKRYNERGVVYSNFDENKFRLQKLINRFRLMDIERTFPVRIAFSSNDWIQRQNYKDWGAAESGKTLVQFLHDNEIVFRSGFDWRNTSTNYCNDLSGNVYTCVATATKNSVFRGTECEILVNNPQVKTINEQPHEKYQNIYRDILNRAPVYGVVDTEKQRKLATDCAYYAIAKDEIAYQTKINFLDKAESAQLSGQLQQQCKNEFGKKHPDILKALYP